MASSYVQTISPGAASTHMLTPVSTIEIDAKPCVFPETFPTCSPAHTAPQVSDLRVFLSDFIEELLRFSASLNRRDMPHARTRPECGGPGDALRHRSGYRTVAWTQHPFPPEWAKGEEAALAPLKTPLPGVLGLWHRPCNPSPVARRSGKERRTEAWESLARRPEWEENRGNFEGRPGQ